MNTHTGPRQMDEPEVMGASEVADTVGVLQPNIRALVGLPEPYMKVRATTLWRADEIWAYAQARNARKAVRAA